jgi:hypothetical protein
MAHVETSSCLAVLACAAAAVLRWNALAASDPVLDLATDSVVYVNLANDPLMSASFWTGGRPVTLPLFLKAVGLDIDRIVAAQGLMSTIAWSVLAVAAAACRQRALAKGAAAAIVLGIGLSSPVAAWDGVVLSESLSLSLMAFTWAGVLLLTRRWHPMLAAGVVLSMALWSQARDTDGLFLGIAGVLAFGVVWMFGGDRRWLVLAACALVVFLFGQRLSEAAQRWTFPFYNVLTQRVLGVAERQEFFSARGMPTPPELTTLAGQWASSNDWALYRAPELEGFRQWALESGRSTYFRYLLAHPFYVAAGPWSDRRRLFGPDLQIYQPRDYASALGWLDRLLLAPDRAMGLYAGMLLIGIAGVTRWRRGLTADQGAMVLALLSVLGLAILVWHADAMEVSRHALSAAVQWHLGCSLLLVSIVDRALSADPVS